MTYSLLIDKALRWRQLNDLYQADGAIRLFAGLADGEEGLIIDQYGPFIMATLYRYHSQISDSAQQLLEVLETLLPQHTILIRARLREKSNEYFYLNSSTYQKDAVYWCQEAGANYEIHCDPRHDFGLYLDTKSARQWVRDHSADKRVLNLFSYTCAFAVAAAMGRAQEVVNIDPAKEYLDWGGRNALANHLVYKRYQDTTQDYLARHLRRLESGKDQHYDLTIFDPPAFLVGRGSERLARNMWAQWMGSLKQMQCSNFLFVFNDKDMARQFHLPTFIQEGLGLPLSVTALPQSLDVLGQNGLGNDPCYYLPQLFFVQRML